MTGHIILQKCLFTANEKTLFELEGLKATAFLFSTGVQGIKIENPSGFIVVLPYQGQQIWDIVFHGRRLKMVNFFPEPVPSSLLMDSYGAFLFHCGALRMGTPGPEDTHPLHGELPGAQYDEASLLFGEDEKGPYLGVSGVYHYVKAFGDRYDAVPTVTLHRDDTILNVNMTVRNLAHAPMDLMYMCHVNFLPADNGEIIQATGWGTEDMVVRSSIPGHVKPTPQYLAFLDSLKKNPGVTRVLRPEDRYNPEIVFYIRNLKSDSHRMTHMLQKHRDGSSDYIGYNVNDLNHTVRWILKNDDQKVMGMALPSTCDPEGYSAERKKGNVRTIPGLGKAGFSVMVGYLDAAGTKRFESVIAKL